MKPKYFLPTIAIAVILFGVWIMSRVTTESSAAKLCAAMNSVDASQSLEGKYAVKFLKFRTNYPREMTKKFDGLIRSAPNDQKNDLVTLKDIFYDAARNPQSFLGESSLGYPAEQRLTTWRSSTCN